MIKLAEVKKIIPRLAIVMLPIFSAILTLQLILTVLKNAQGRGLIDTDLAWEGFDQKLKSFAQNKDTYEAIFLGSSASTKIMMTDFDGQLATRGITIHSFNFSETNTYYEEIFEILSSILEIKPANLKWVFFDVSALSSVRVNTRTGKAEKSNRTIRWHNFRNTFLITKHLWTRDIPAQDKLSFSLQHWELFLLRMVTPRFTASYKTQDRNVSEPIESSETCRDIGNPFEPKMPVSAFEKAIDRLPASCGEENLDVYLTLQFERIVSTLREANPEIKVISFWPPKFRQKGFCNIPTSIGNFNILNFQNTQHLSLYDYEERYDNEHLNCVGAKRFSIMLANEVASLIKTGGN